VRWSRRVELGGIDQRDVVLVDPSDFLVLCAHPEIPGLMSVAKQRDGVANL